MPFLFLGLRRRIGWQDHSQMARFLFQIRSQIASQDSNQLGCHWEQVGQEEHLEKSFHRSNADRQLVAQVKDSKDEKVKGFEENG
jgi:hypothetical protein